MMDELRMRRLRALKETMAHPFFAEAIKDLRHELATEIADTLDHDKADALRAERIALSRIEGRLTAYLNEIQFAERKHG